MSQHFGAEDNSREVRNSIYNCSEISGGSRLRGNEQREMEDGFGVAGLN